MEYVIDQNARAQRPSDGTGSRTPGRISGTMLNMQGPAQEVHSTRVDPELLTAGVPAHALVCDGEAGVSVTTVTARFVIAWVLTRR